MKKPLSITRIASSWQPHLTNEEINECLEGKCQIEWVMGSVSDKKELWTCDVNRISVLAGPLTEKEMKQYIENKTQHYVVYGRKTVDRNHYASAEGIYFFWCCANSEPYIAITPSRKYCNVSIDLITLEDSRKITLDDDGRKEIFELLTKSTIHRPGAMWCAGPISVFAYSNSILSEKGFEVATGLYRIWAEHKTEKSDNEA